MRILGSGESEAGQAGEVGQAGHEVPGAAVDPGGVDLDQDLVRQRWSGRWTVRQLEHVGRAVAVLDDGSHGGRPAPVRWQWLGVGVGSVVVAWSVLRRVWAVVLSTVTGRP